MTSQISEIYVTSKQTQCIDTHSTKNTYTMFDIILLGLCGSLTVVLGNQIRNLERERRREAERREREAIEEHNHRRMEAGLKHFLEMLKIAAQILFTFITAVGIIYYHFQSGNFANGKPIR